MSRLPRVSGREAVSALPDHRELQAGTLRALIRKAGLSVEQFEELLRR